jgi:hypothetical protein
MTSSKRSGFAFAVAAVGVVGAAAVVAACGTKSGATIGNNGGNQSLVYCDGGTSTVVTTAGSCANPTIPIEFSPMYSAYISTNAIQTFSIPAVTADHCPATWSLSDPSQADLHAEGFAFGSVTQPGAMVTMKGTGGSTGPESSGQVTVIATEADGTCGASVLTITQNTPNDWTIGNARYTQGVSLHAGGTEPDGGTAFTESDGGTPCVTCHSSTVKTGEYTDVAHTPEQAGGFSDEEMKSIVLYAQVPDGGYFDPAVIDSTCTGAGTTLSPSMPACAQSAYATFQSFHQWSDIGSDQIAGMICKLRSLIPEGQAGTSNFGQ